MEHSIKDEEKIMFSLSLSAKPSLTKARTSLKSPPSVTSLVSLEEEIEYKEKRSLSASTASIIVPNDKIMAISRNKGTRILHRKNSAPVLLMKSDSSNISSSSIPSISFTDVSSPDSSPLPSPAPSSSDASFMKSRECVGYQLKKILIDGATRIESGTHLTTSKNAALKIVNSELNHQQLKREYEHIKSMPLHTNIVNVFEMHFSTLYPNLDGISHDRKDIMVMELANEGDLFSYVNLKDRFNQLCLDFIFSQITKAVCHCHENKVFHRDIKPENILIHCDYESSESEGKKWTFILNDFGHSTKNEKSRSICGTTYYIAPEVHVGEYNCQAADIWALGVLLFVLVSGFPPFKFADKTDWFFNCILNNHRDKFWQLHSTRAAFSVEIKDTINLLLTVDPIMRVSNFVMLKDDIIAKGQKITNYEFEKDFMLLRKKKIEKETFTSSKSIRKSIKQLKDRISV